MKMTGNCRVYRMADCPYLRWPFYHSGFTGKSGPETWWHCARTKKPIRYVRKCEFAGKPDEARKAWTEEKAKEAMSGKG